MIISKAAIAAVGPASSTGKFPPRDRADGDWQESMTIIRRGSDGKIQSYAQSDLLPALTWETRPDMTHSGAPEDLQRAWVAVVMAYREIFGAITEGECLPLNMAAGQIVSHVLDEDVDLCGGFALFVTGKGAADSAEFGRRFCPDKWRKHLYHGVITPAVPDENDFHVWLETKTHVIDFTTFQIAPMMRTSNEAFPVKGAEGTFPPMLYWAKSALPQHLREAWGDRKLLLWRASRALTASDIDPQLARIEPVIRRSVEIYKALKRGERIEPAETNLLRAVLA